MPTLSDRLKSLGVQVGAKDLPPPRPAKTFPVEEIVAGRFVDTGNGSTYLIEQDFPVDYIHGLIGLAYLHQTLHHCSMGWGGRNCRPKSRGAVVSRY